MEDFPKAKVKTQKGVKTLIEEETYICRCRIEADTQKENYSHIQEPNMTDTESTNVIELANKFKNATLELGESSDPIVYEIEVNPKDGEESQWDVSLVGKIIIEEKMIHKEVENLIKFTWTFIP